MYASNLLADEYKSSLNGINFEWTAGQINKKALKAGLPILWSITSKMAPSKFWGTTKKEPAARKVGETMQGEQSLQC
jgi:hypothetical protein